MSGDLRRDSATATLGLGGVGVAAGLRHTGLERAYGGKKRPPLAQELRLLKHGSKGRRIYLAGSATGLLAIPTAAVGLYGSGADVKAHYAKAEDKQQHGFLVEGALGAKDALTQRNTTLVHPAPIHLQAGNYAGGALVGSLSGGAVNMALRHKKLPGAVKAGLAAMTGITAGTSALPVQSTLMNQYTHGKYEVTPTGVQRKKRKAVRPSARATVVEARPGRSTMHPAALREAMVPSSVNKHGERLAADWTVGLNAAANSLEGRRLKHGRLVRAGTVGAIRSLARDASPLSNISRGYNLMKYAGQDLTRGQKRARVVAVNGPPIIGDIAQASLAGKLAPPGMQRRSAATYYAGNLAGGTVGQVGGAAGALALANRFKTVQRGSEKVSDASDAASNTLRHAVGMKPKTGPGMIARAAESPKVPQLARRVLRPIAKNPKVAAAGMLLGGAVGGPIGGQLAYTNALNAEDRYKRMHTESRRGQGKVRKADTHIFTERERAKLRRTKERNAALSTVGGVTGTGALVATLGHKVPRLPPRVRNALGAMQVPLLTSGAGIGGINAFVGASVQRKEAQQRQVLASKSFLSTGIRRAPSIRRGTIRQTRFRSGVTRVSSVRGGLA